MPLCFNFFCLEGGSEPPTGARTDLPRTPVNIRVACSGAVVEWTLSIPKS